MNGKPKIVVIFFLLFVACCIQSSAQIAAPEILDVSIKNLAVKDTTVPYILLMLADKYHVPVGLEYPDSELSANKKIEIDVKDLPLRKVCDLIVEQNPDFKWELNDGVINFLPAANRNSLVERLLKTKYFILCAKETI